MIPVRDHLDMLSEQYLASALRPDHPAHEPVSRPAGRRDKKKTLQSRFKDNIEAHLVDGSLPPGAFPEVKKEIHTRYVSKAISAQGNHPLLNQPTPEVTKTEQDLPRSYQLSPSSVLVTAQILAPTCIE